MNRRMFIIAVIALLLDQVSKSVICSLISVGESIGVISGFFDLVNVQNYGVAFGILQNARFLILIATGIASLLIYKFIFTFKSNFRNNLAFGLIIGGLIGNLIDRIMIGYVRDFISLSFGTYSYPVFNVGDSCIVIGVILLIYAILKGEDVNGSSSK